MAKYYVQSGTIRSIIDSEDAERAALWAVHQAMDAALPLDGCEEMCSDQEHDIPVASDSRSDDPVSDTSGVVWGDDQWDVDSWSLSSDHSISVKGDYVQSSTPAPSSTPDSQSVVRLSESIRISEQGFDREDAMAFDTLEMFRHWFELYNAVTVLASRLSGAC